MMKTCKNCGKGFEGNFCPECGTNSAEEESFVSLGSGIPVAEGLDFRREGDGYSVTGMGTCLYTDFAIPANHEGLPVIKIAPGAFKNCNRIWSVVIPDTVTEIGKEAFMDCRRLTSVTIGRGMKRICGTESRPRPRSFYSNIYAFQGCEMLVEVCNLSSLKIDLGNFHANGAVARHARNIYTEGRGKSRLFDTEEGYRFFSDERNAYLMGYRGPAADIVLPDEGFGGKGYAVYPHAFTSSVIRSVVIPDCVTGIGGHAFSCCHRLTDVKIGKGVIKIGPGAFEWCSSLASIFIPKNVTLVGRTDIYHIKKKSDWFWDSRSDGAFAYCRALTAIDFEKGSECKEIGDKAFTTCESLKTVTLPDGVKLIGNEAFCGCKSLSRVLFPRNVTHIGEEAFAECRKLRRLYFSGSRNDLLNVRKGRKALPKFAIRYFNSDVMPGVGK